MARDQGVVVDPSARVPWWRFSGWGVPSSPGAVRPRDLAVGLLAALAIWYHVDVARRGRVDPVHPEWHMTDFTVFTEAGAALFDGRDPYAVTNPRGWFYLYPPLFALMVAPLAALDPVSQVFAWYVTSVALGFGCAWEVRRLERWVRADPSGEIAPSPLRTWIAVCGGLAVLWPTLECLQRGQLGIALLFALLLGYRLAVTGESWGHRFLGGLALAWAATVKLVPVLPAAFVVWQFAALVLRPGRARGDFGRASAVASGVATGGLLFVLVIPSAFLGWTVNLRHLRTWSDKVVTNADPGRQSGFHLDSASNQSLANAAHSLAIRLRPVGPDDPRRVYQMFARTPAEQGWARDRAVAELRRADHGTRWLVRAAQGVVVTLLVCLAFIPRKGCRAAEAAAFGLSCSATLLISPVAWTHYFMMLLPATLAVPLYLAARDRPTAAKLLAAAPVVLVWSHYLARHQVGSLGLLGLGTAAWFLSCGVVLAVERVRPARPAGHHAPARPAHHYARSPGTRKSKSQLA